jgi:hypothetical protein
MLEEEILANRIIASSVLSKEVQDALIATDPRLRIAMEQLIADGLLEEKEGRLFPTARGLLDPRFSNWKGRLDGE